MNRPPIFRIFGFALSLSGIGLAGAAPGQDVNAVTVRTAYDQDFLYFGFEVRKPNVQASVAGAFQNPLTDDSVIVLLDAGAAPGDTKRSAKSASLALSAAGGVQLYRGEKGTPLAGPGDFMRTADGRLAVFKAAATKLVRDRGRELSGYTAELAIPWLELGGLPAAGQKLRFNVAAISAAPGSPRMMSLSKSVSDAAGLNDPSKWEELSLVETSPPAPPEGVRLCPRVYTVLPIADGEIGAEEWKTSSVFRFTASGAASSAGNLAPGTPARIPRSIKGTPAPPPIPLPPPETVVVPELKPQPVPRLLFALYRIDFQADPRRPGGARLVRSEAGASLLKLHPLTGSGPWMSGERAGWHRDNLAQMAEAGVDVAAVQLSAAPYSQAAVERSVRALAIAAEESTITAPLLSLALDTANSTATERRRAIRAFFRWMPAGALLSVPLSAENGGGAAHVVWLRGGSAAGWSDEEARRLRSEHLAETGRDLFVVQEKDPAWLRFASLQAPAAPQGKTPVSELYRQALRKNIAQGAPWQFVDSWNDFLSGHAIAPTMERGVLLADATRAFWQLAGGAGAAAVLVSHDLRANLPSLSAFSAEVVLRAPSAASASRKYRLVWTGNRGGADLPATEEWELPDASPGSLVRMRLNLRHPGAEGSYVLSVRSTGRQAPATPEAAAFRSGGKFSAMPGVHVVFESLPRVIESGGEYAAKLVLRNAGNSLWPKGAILRPRLWRENDGGKREPAGLADAPVALQNDVAPGAETSLDVRVPVVRGDGTPVPVSPAEYEISWELAGAGASATSPPRPIAVVAEDPGAEFVANRTPRSLPGERRVPVRLGLRNAGPLAWKQGSVRIGAHWYYLDGTETLFEDETTPLETDLQPGETVEDVLAWVTPPPFDGTYWLVWDVRFGEAWTSEGESVRLSETLVERVEIVNGRLRHVNLDPVFNVDGVSSEDDPAEGDFDGKGAALPVGETPPFVTGDPVPAGVYTAFGGAGLDALRRFSFRWGSKAPGAKNAVRCEGQRVVVATDPKKAESFRAVHLLAAATRPGVRAAFTLVFTNGAEQFITFPMTSWTETPTRGERVVFETAQARSGPAPGATKTVRLFQYTIPVSEARPLAAIVLPKEPDARVLAISLEK